MGASVPDGRDAKNASPTESEVNEMAKFGKKVQDAVEKYYFSAENNAPNLAKCSRNLSLLAVRGELPKCYHRDNELVSIQKILLRRNKANVLLTGAAGCGKTAIAEGLAYVFAQRALGYKAEKDRLEREYKRSHEDWQTDWKNEVVGFEPPPKPFLCETVVFELSLNALVGGTKYRGEFEEKLEQVIKECKRNPNIVLFIDEIHQIGTVGASDGSEGAAQILKPALARKDIRVIGATTTEEKAYIMKDKALARRFCEVEVAQLTGESANQTAENILKDYMEYHKVKTDISAERLLDNVQYFLPQSVFPDNFINLVDETFAGAVFDGLNKVDMSHFNATLSRLAGVVIVGG